MKTTIWKNNNLLLRLAEHTRSKVDVENTLTKEQEVRIEHLIKLFYYRDFTNYVWGWKASCRKGLENPIKIRTGKKAKFLTFDDMFEILYEEWEDTLQKYHDRLLDDISFDRVTYKDLPLVESPNFFDFKGFFKDYCLTVSNLLSSGNYFSARDNSEILDDILLKYTLKS